MPRTKDYNIRVANEDDLSDIYILGKQFAKESGNGFLGWNSTKVKASLEDVIAREDFGAFVLCKGENVVGMFICFATPCFFSDKIQAVEIAWYVEPEHRGSRKAVEMLNWFEEWGKHMGAVCVNMVNLDMLNPEKVAKMYKKRGYRIAENTFVKEL